jgi:hypothetical protein
MVYGFGSYFTILPGTDLSSLLLIYGFPISILGFALSYAQVCAARCAGMVLHSAHCVLAVTLHGSTVLQFPHNFLVVACTLLETYVQWPNSSSSLITNRASCALLAVLSSGGIVHGNILLLYQCQARY